MKKGIYGLLIASLLGTTPFTASAITNNQFSTVAKSITKIVIESDQRRPKHGRDDDSNRKRQDDRRREEERREQERREKERREWERRERERLEREKREQREDARYIIHRTAEIIQYAQKSSARRHYYRGLALAVAHQRKAQSLYRSGYYREAIFHSLRARRLALSVIAGNRDRYQYRDDREHKYYSHSPKDKDLDLQIDLYKIGKDYDARIIINLDLD